MGENRGSSGCWSVLQEHFPLLNIKIRAPQPAQSISPLPDGRKVAERKTDRQLKMFRESEGYSCSGGFPTLPAEILHQIFEYLPPRAQVCLSLTCRFLYNFTSPTVSFRSLSFEERIECFFDLAADSQSRYFVSTTLHCTDCGQTTRISTLKATQNAGFGPEGGEGRLARVILHIRDINPVRPATSKSLPEPTAAGLEKPGYFPDPNIVTYPQLAFKSDQNTRRSSEVDVIKPIDMTMCLRYPSHVKGTAGTIAENITTFMACLHCSKFYCHYTSTPPENWSYVKYPPWLQYTGPRSWKLYDSSWTIRYEPDGKSTFFGNQKVRLHKTRDKIPCEYGLGAVISGGQKLALGQQSGNWRPWGKATRWFEKQIEPTDYYKSGLTPMRQKAAMRGDRDCVAWSGGELVSLDVYLRGCTQRYDSCHLSSMH